MCSGERHQWNSHNRIDPVAKEFIRSLQSNSIPLSRLYGVLGSAFGGSSESMFTRSSLRRVCSRLSQESIVDDIGKTLDSLRTMQEQDPNLAVCMDSDNEGRVKSILWCTGKNRADYASFGDAITFDTTYRTNLYDMPFGIFVGVNHHLQISVSRFNRCLVYFDHKFGKHVCFNVFLGSTDQCAAMEAAISNVLNNTRHRWCRWHVLRTAKEKIGPVYSKYSGFRKEFHTLINDVLCPNDFERGWRKLVAKYNLGNNTYLHRIYTKRVVWAKPYFTGDFSLQQNSHINMLCF